MLNSAEIPNFLSWPICKRIIRVVAAHGGEARFVGGAVRNHLLGKKIDDVDMAVNRPIEDVASWLVHDGLSIYETGIAHGTITVRFDGKSVELTQTRKDAETDGRHARVIPVDDWLEDAQRRDFTINAVYMDGAGTLFDFVGGRSDLTAGILRFIGDAEHRICEDYLRILRAFRFLSEYPELRFSEGMLTSLSQHMNGLQQLSGERVTNEWMRLLSGQGWRQALALSIKSRLDHTLFGRTFTVNLHLPLAENLTSLGRFAWLLGPNAALPDWLRLSRADSNLLSLYAQKLDQKTVIDLLSDILWRQTAYTVGVDVYQRLILSLLWDGRGADDATLKRIATFQPPAFPLRGADLMSEGIAPGVLIGKMLLSLEQAWVASDFQLGKDVLLALLPELMKDYDDQVR